MSILPRTFNAELIKKEYARVAWTYNLWSRFTESRASAKMFDLAEIRDGENILEVAVGIGVVFDGVSKLNPNGINVGIDLSPSMLAKAMKRLESHHNYLSYGNAFLLPFKDNQFDLVINNYMFDLLPEAKFKAILLEFKRVLKNSGRVVITNMAYGEYWFNKFWYWLAKSSPSILTGCRPVSLEGYLKKAGFSNIQLVNISQNTFPSEIITAKIKPLMDANKH